MNRKEVNEIRKNFTEQSGFLTIHKILTSYIDAEKTVRFHQVRSGITMPEDEGAMLKDTLRRVLSSNVGKALTEYEFPQDAYLEGGAQAELYALLQSKLEEEAPINAFLTRIADEIDYNAAFAVITAYCTYTIRTKDKMDEFTEDADEEYRFLLTGFCQANTGADGLVFDENNNSLLKKENHELIVSKLPSDGFLYPVFNDRSPDINHVMYYTKTPNKPNISIIDDILGCQFIMSAQNEKAEFQNILKAVVGDELDYMMITTVNEKLTEVAKDKKTETEVPTIDSAQLKNLLYDVGVSEERLTTVNTVYEKAIGNAPLTVTNLIETRTVLTTPEITVHIKPTATDKVRTSVIGGRRCLLIDLDDPCIEINGLPTNLGGAPEETPTT